MHVYITSSLSIIMLAMNVIMNSNMKKEEKQIGIQIILKTVRKNQ